MRRAVTCFLAVTVLVTGLLVGGMYMEAGAASKDMVIANLPKAVGGAWFNRMKVGFERFNKDTGIETFQTGADRGDAALQVQEVQNLIAQRVDAIAVVPVAQEALEPILKTAMDAGIIVISHEAAGIENVHYNVEAFDNAAYGAHLMDQLAKAMGETGEYVVCVGSLTARSHMEWAQGAVARQKEAYPNMTCVNADAFIETNYNQRASRDKGLEIMKTYPEIKGFFVTSATDLPGFALAIEDARKEGEIHLVGNGLPSANKDYILSGALTFLGCWDPADTGYVMAKVAAMVKDGGSVNTGDDLGVQGYNNVLVKGNIIIGEAWRNVTKDTLAENDF